MLKSSNGKNNLSKVKMIVSIVVVLGLAVVFFFRYSGKSSYA